MYFDRHRTFYICRCWRSRVQEAEGSQAGQSGRRGMLRSDWVDKCENNQRHLYPPLPSILWCGFQTMMTAINKGDQEDNAMTEATKIIMGLQPVCVDRPNQFASVCNQYKSAAYENSDHFKLQFFHYWRIEDKTSISRTLKSENLHLYMTKQYPWIGVIKTRVRTVVFLEHWNMATWSKHNMDKWVEGETWDELCVRRDRKESERTQVQSNLRDRTWRK